MEEVAILVDDNTHFDALCDTQFSYANDILNIWERNHNNKGKTDGSPQLHQLESSLSELIKLVVKHISTLKQNPDLSHNTQGMLLNCFKIVLPDLEKASLFDVDLFEHDNKKFHLHLVLSSIKQTLKYFKKNIKDNPSSTSIDIILSKGILNDLLYKLDLCQYMLGFTEKFKQSKALAKATHPTQQNIETLIRWLKINHYTEHRGWNNFMESFPVNRAIVVEVNSEAQVSALIKKINFLNSSIKLPHQRITIRAAAGCDKTFSISGLFPCTKESMDNKYRASYSGTEGTLGEVIVRFSLRYQNQIHVNQDPNNPTVDVPAGTQIEKLDNVLWETGSGYSLSTSSMIRYVSATGLMANAGIGTGINEPAFAGLAVSFTICDAKGDICEISQEGEGENATYKKKKKNEQGQFEEIEGNHKDTFLAIRGAHLGLFGIVLKVRMKCVPKLYLSDERVHFHTINDMTTELKERLLKNNYTTIFAFPPYKTDDEIREHNQFPFALCFWNKVDLKEEDKKHVKKPEEFFWKFKHEFLVDTGESMLRLLNDYPEFTPFFMRFAAALELKDQQTYIGESRHVMHSIPTYPNEITGCCFLFPVAKKNCAEKVQEHLNHINARLLAYAENGEYPVSLATYVRFIKGTNGGLSTSSTKERDELDAEDDEEVIVSLETFTQKDNPSFPKFRAEMSTYFLQAEPRVKFHLGKYIPDAMSFQSIYSPDEFNQFFSQLEHWCGSLDQLEKSPFLTPFFTSKIFDQKLPAHVLLPEVVSKPIRPRDPIFIQKVIKHLEDMEKSEFRHYGVIKPAEDPRKQVLQSALGDFKGELHVELNKFTQDNSANNQDIQQSVQQINVQKVGK